MVFAQERTNYAIMKDALLVDTCSELLHELWSNTCHTLSFGNQVQNRSMQCYKPRSAVFNIALVSWLGGPPLILCRNSGRMRPTGNRSCSSTCLLRSRSAIRESQAPNTAHSRVEWGIWVWFKKGDPQSYHLGKGTVAHLDVPSESFICS